MSHEDYKIELFVFPDGTPVEMIVFDRGDRRGAAAPSAPRRAGRSAAAPSRSRRPAPCCVPAPPPPEDADAHHCPVCGSTLVYPIDWDRSGARQLDAASSAAPSARRGARSMLGRASVEEFNRELYHGAQAIAREADRMTRRNFEEEVERIVVALERDLILPMDF